MSALNRKDAYRIAQDVTCGEATEFEVESALYWWAADHHEGQWSELYSTLSTSPYKPGPLEGGPEPDSPSGMIYRAMCGEASCSHEESTR